MKLIPLTKGFSAIVDDEDFEYLNQFQWQANKQKYTYYATRSALKAEYVNGRRISAIPMHREIMKLNKLDKNVVDHNDKNGLNNQKSNLIVATKSQNSQNRKSMEGAASKYLGVTISQGFHKRKLKNGNIKLYPYKWWVAKVTINKKSTYIGSFKTEKEAAIAFNNAAIKHNLTFVKLNIIE